MVCEYEKDWPVLIIVPPTMLYSWVDSIELWLCSQGFCRPGHIDLVRPRIDFVLLFCFCLSVIPTPTMQVASASKRPGRATGAAAPKITVVTFTLAHKLQQELGALNARVVICDGEATCQSCLEVLIHSRELCMTRGLRPGAGRVALHQR